MRTVVFQVKVPPYMGGEVAGFSDDEAADLVARGLAEYTKADAAVDVWTHPPGQRAVLQPDLGPTPNPVTLVVGERPRPGAPVVPLAEVPAPEGEAPVNTAGLVHGMEPEEAQRLTPGMPATQLGQDPPEVGPNVADADTAAEQAREAVGDADKPKAKPKK